MSGRPGTRPDIAERNRSQWMRDKTSAALKWRKHSWTNGKVAAPLIDRIADRSIPEPNTGCWLWIGARDKDGYGRMEVAGQHKRAHRVSYEVHVGQIPDGLVIDHVKARGRACRTCRNAAALAAYYRNKVGK